MTRRPLFSLISSLTAILILAAGCSEQSPTALRLEPASSALAGTGLSKVQLATSGQARRVTRTIGTEGGTIQVDRLTLSFPAGALSKPTEISVSLSTKHLEAKLGPHGTQFPAGHEPTLSFDYSGLQDLDESGLTIVYLGEHGEVLETMPTQVDAALDLVSTKLPHFSVYATATP